MKELVGANKPFHSAIDKTAALLKRKVGTGAEFMKELQALGGVKQSEIEDRRLGELMNMPKMTHEQFLGELGSRPLPAIQEKVLDDKPYGFLNNANPTHHEKWTLSGGDNYREMLIKAPKGVDNQEKIMELEAKLRRIPMFNSTPEQQADIAKYYNQIKELKEQEQASPKPFQGVDIHFGGEPAILASMRLKDRTGPNGEKLLHLEELQSDWHQQGREKGYKSNASEDDVRKAYNAQEFNAVPFDELRPEDRAYEIQKYRESGVPDAPFKKNWEEMALKRLIHHAAEKGYHGIVVTSGADQADRYDLSKHISGVDYIRNELKPQRNEMIAYDPKGNVIFNEFGMTPEKLEEHIGKDAAQKLLSQEPEPNKYGLPTHSLRGEELVVGGEGMKGFYDKKVPNILNSIGKKYGVTTQLNGQQVEVKPAKRIPVIREHDIDYHGRETEPAQTKPVHYFPITEEMRSDILKNGLPLYQEGGIIHKAQGGNVQPTTAQMKLALIKANPLNIQSIGANEAPDMMPKAYMPPDSKSGEFVPSGGVTTPSGMAIGGVDMSQQPGSQLLPMNLLQPQQPLPPQPDPSQPAPPQAGGSNILSLTPQGQALSALKPQQPAGMAKGGQPSVETMKKELAKKKSEPEEKRILVKAEGAGGVKGIVVPKHLITGNPKAYAEGLENMMDARAKVYGSEHREPLSGKKIEAIHKQALHEHFQLPIEEQRQDEEEALNRLREAKFIKHNKDTLDESEKLDTVHHEYDEKGRSHVGYASKGIAGHALFPQGHGEDMDYKVLNTCAGQTTGCGGGVDASGIVDTKRGTCFAPNAESQYAAAASRRAGHTIAKHDPAMTRDWIIAHTGSMRNAAERADKNNQRMLFRPNVVDETDTTSRHVIRHLNRQRQTEDLPDIISNQYGKTNELHDPENGYYVTHSNIGPKVKHGHEITENIGRDKARVRNTIMAADNKGDFKNEQGNLTPPKGSYLVTNVKRGSPMAKKIEDNITHAKYWTTGREAHELTPEEKEEGTEGHFGPNGKPTTPEKAHYGHTTVNGRRYDYQRQHILHPRLVQVGTNDDGTPHMIPTDSRFKDEEFLPKNRFMTKNGKKAGHILMTTPTESTDNIGHHTPFTHDVSESSVEHAKKNNGEYEIDSPMEQEKARGKEYVAPKAIKIVRKAQGGTIGGRHHGYEHDDFFAFPEQNVIAQHHLAKRLGEDETEHKPSKGKMPVHLTKSLDTMRYELTRNK